MQMSAAVQNVVSAFEQAQKERRLRKSKQRISEALLTLRAASAVHLEQQQQQQQRRDDDNDTDNDHSNFVWGNDLGSALLCPLPTTTSPQQHQHQHQHQSRQSASSSNNSLESLVVDSTPPQPGEQTLNDDDDYDPVHILPEPNHDDTTLNPRLLSQDQFQQLVTEGVPKCWRMNSWTRLYSIGRDGDSFQSLVTKCRNYEHTILVAQTTTGHLLGGFGAAAWNPPNASNASRGSGRGGTANNAFQNNPHAYYGTGNSFLFASHPATSTRNSQQQKEPNDNDSNRLSIYPWTGSNDFCQICDPSKSVLAMGGAGDKGAFGFILQDDFNRGSTDSCDTFGNPPLVPNKDGLFNVAALEVYGLVPYGMEQTIVAENGNTTSSGMPTTTSTKNSTPADDGMLRSGFGNAAATVNTTASTTTTTDHGTSKSLPAAKMIVSAHTTPTTASLKIRKTNNQSRWSPIPISTTTSNSSVANKACQAGSLIPRSAHCF